VSSPFLGTVYKVFTYSVTYLIVS